MVLGHLRSSKQHSMHSMLVSTAGSQKYTLRRHHSQLQGVPAQVLIR